MTMKGFQMNC